MIAVFRGIIRTTALCTSQRQPRFAVKSLRWGAVAVVAFVALVLAGCTKTGTGATPGETPLPPSSSTPSSAPPSIIAPAAPATMPASPQPVPSGGIVPVHDPGQVTGTLTGPCHMTGTYPDQFPDPRCTPGSYDPAVTQANIHSTICVKGYTAKIRPPESQTSAFKYNIAYVAYGDAKTVKTELDHFLPLELGGSNDARNLWPEPETSIPNKKDYIEDAARVAVCSGKMSLRTAQDDMAANWVLLGQFLKVK